MRCWSVYLDSLREQYELGYISYTEYDRSTMSAALEARRERQWRKHEAAKIRAERREERRMREVSA